MKPVGSPELSCCPYEILNFEYLKTTASALTWSTALSHFTLMTLMSSNSMIRYLSLTSPSFFWQVSVPFGMRFPSAQYWIKAFEAVSMPFVMRRSSPFVLVLTSDVSSRGASLATPRPSR